MIKLGGSLLAEPGRLRGWLAAIADGAHGPCLVVPGGGPFADAVREAQAALGFADSLAHRLALDAMGHMAEAFCGIEPRLYRSAGLSSPLRGRAEGGCGAGGVLAVPSEPPPPLTPPRKGEGKAIPVWDPAALREGRPDIPETWDVTSDSLALWLARETGAARCVLVKSADAPPGRSPAELARLGLVDAAFPAFAARFAGAIALWGPSGVVPLGERAAA
ncbi:hypothetical protein MPOCJGCO_2168 [Methylobacterium trifolii]|uniref:Uridylate kinase n=1 Tax=Methylobacterium trifolii TaxID=1003092 RepID=A0ABQ4TXU2_9HYPH|nr:hypothetical protein MPOCJGCO_2168 [Methylobacterium trifolii]